LRRQKDILANYADAISEAHDGCRKASQLVVCNNLATKLPSTPDLASVEAPPVVAPVAGQYTFAIDGIPVAPAQNVALLANVGDTLFNAAKEINGIVTNVDVLATITSPYVAAIDVIMIRPEPQHLPSTVGGAKLLPQDLQLPAYFPQSASGYLALRVLHADAQHPCPIRLSTGTYPLKFVDEACLTNTGQLLRYVALADVANHVIASTQGKTTTWNFTLTGVVQDCFGKSVPQPLATLNINVSPGPPRSSKVTAMFGLNIMLPTVWLPLAEYSELRMDQHGSNSRRVD
jgi:hypothetical protein